MRSIYNELRKYNGKLQEFSEYAHSIGLYADTKGASQALRYGVRPNPTLQKVYEEWKHGKLRTKDVEKYNTKVANVFKEIKRRDIKEELVSIHEVLEESLMELTVAIKKNDKEKLTEVKEMLQNALYGSVA